MAHTKSVLLLIALATFGTAAAASAQQQKKDTLGSPPGTVEAKLVFDREVFAYSGNGRRDPFKPLLGKESLGPLFEDLKLKVIIYSQEPNRSIVLVEDGAKRIYRLRRGDVVGNSRVVEITPLAVRFAVENFGSLRYQVLELRAGAGVRAGLTETNAIPAQLTPAAAEAAKQVDQATAKRMLDSLAKQRHEQAPQAPKKQDDSNERPIEPEARR